MSHTARCAGTRWRSLRSVFRVESPRAAIVFLDRILIMKRDLIRFALIIGAVAAMASSRAAAAQDDGFKSIFDGKTLTGWDGNPEHWSVEDGAITGQATKAQAMKHNTFIIWRQGELDDFELKAEFRLMGG